METVLGTTPAGNMEAIPDLKRRQRAVYFREIPAKDGQKLWRPTLPLPSDPMGKEQYLTKGFRLTPPETTSITTEITKPESATTTSVKGTEVKSIYECSQCDFVTKNEWGLGVHVGQRHKGTKNEKEVTK